MKKQSKSEAKRIAIQKQVSEVEKTTAAVGEAIKQVEEVGQEFDRQVKDLTGKIDEAMVMAQNGEIRLYDGDQFWFFRMTYKPHVSAGEEVRTLLIRHSNALSAYLLAKDYCHVFFSKDAIINSVTKI
jgi:hypothetical protein